MTEREIFARTLEIQAAAERAAFVDQACCGNSSLRQRVEELLAEQGNLGSYLEVPVSAVATIERPAVSRAGMRVGRYRLLEEIGEGGMGTVWVAEQTEPVKRRVALKLIKPGMDSRQVLSRFEAERQALALMDHPNIAKVYDGGMTDEGRPFFVMEYVKGMPITEYCDSARLSIRDRLKLFIPVCQAVQHAHQKGIIHRDIKPSNILVCLYDGQPVPKVIDFGLAKAMHQPLTEHTLYTAHGLMVGTPLYMSPEQAEFNNLDVDTRSDIYSLGVILYELLTGTTPLEKQQFKDAVLQEVLRLIKEVEPQRPSLKISTSVSLPSIAAQRNIEPAQLSRTVRGELDWIVMKALEKDRTRRYETANGLARDIERHLHDEPVEAGPPSTAYRLKKLAQKHRTLLAMVATIAVLLVTGTTVSTWQAIRATRAEAVARASEQKAHLAESRERSAKEQALLAAAAESKAKESALEREGETQAVLDFVEKKILSADRPEGQAGGLGPEVTLHRVIEATLPLLHQSFQNQPVIEARLRGTLGWSFLCLGDFATAEQQFQASRAIFTKHRGPDHPDTLKSMYCLAVSYRCLYRLDEALKLYDETLTAQKAKYGVQDVNTFPSMEGLARTYHVLGWNDKALKLHEELLALRKSKFGADDVSTLRSMCFVAETNLALGRHAEAVELYEETLARCQVNLGSDHPDTLLTMNGLAAGYAFLGRYAEGLRLRETLLAAQKAKYGRNHPDTLWTMRGMASNLVALGRGAEAVPIIDDCVSLAAGRVVNPRLLPDLIDLRRQHFMRTKNAAGCRETAEIWESLNRTGAGSLYKAAKLRAVTAKIIRTTDPSDTSAKDAEAEADRAMECLQKAVAAGYSNAAQLAQDKDLDTLQSREDFQALLAAVQAAQRSDPK